MASGNETKIVSFEGLRDQIRQLDDFAQNSIKQKVNELNGIVDEISRNWHGANAEKYKKNVEEINTSIDNFRKDCLTKIVEDLDRQVEAYSNYENES